MIEDLVGLVDGDIGRHDDDDVSVDTAGVALSLLETSDAVADAVEHMEGIRIGGVLQLEQPLERLTFLASDGNDGDLSKIKTVVHDYSSGDRQNYGRTYRYSTP